MGRDQSSRPVGLSRAALLPDLARREGSVQTDLAWSGVGGASTAGRYDRILALLRQAGGHRLGWNSLPRLCIRVPDGVDVLLERFEQQRQQPCRKFEPDNQGLFPANDYSGSRCSGRAGRFRDCLFDYARVDGRLSSAGNRGGSDIAAAGAVDFVAGAWHRTLDVGVKRQISRYSVRAAVWDSALDVRDSDHLSDEPCAGEMALAFEAEPDDWNR